MKFYIETYGCTANQGDSKKIESLLIRKGYSKVENESDADTIVINTCIVTKRTELNVLKRIEEVNKSKNLIVAGCLPAAKLNLLSNSVEVITPNLLNYEFNYGLEGVIGTVNISNGCSGNCSYCIVKRARGDLISFSPKYIMATVKNHVRNGAKEVRITSQDCSSYGLDKNTRLPDLIKDITSIEGSFKIRIGMMNPATMMDIQDDLIDVFDNQKIFKFLHIPVQSGSNRILDLMNRNYDVSDFLDIVNSFKKKFPKITISTDFIIGFPTETEDDFKKSLDLLETIKAEKVNITRFSPRPNTEAANMKDMLDRTKKERSRVFTSVYKKIALESNKKWEKKTLDVLITEKGKKGGVVSRDSTYKNIIIKEDLPLGESRKVKITKATPSYLMAEVVSP